MAALENDDAEANNLSLVFASKWVAPERLVVVKLVMQTETGLLTVW